MERATGIEPVLPAWESILGALYFQYLQNPSERINVHAAHTVHAVPDMRFAAGRLRDGVSSKRVTRTTPRRVLRFSSKVPQHYLDPARILGPLRYRR